MPERADRSNFLRCGCVAQQVVQQSLISNQLKRNTWNLDIVGWESVQAGRHLLKVKPLSFALRPSSHTHKMATDCPSKLKETFGHDGLMQRRFEG